MTTKHFVLAVAAFALITSSRAEAQFDDASDSANATATIVAPISISKTADLRFANVVAGATTGSVEVTPAGVRSATGGALLANNTGGGAAGFDVSGDPNATFAITLPSSIVISDGTNDMTVDTFMSTPSAAGTLSGAGAATVAVGATLQVEANQPQGSYTGTFNVMVAYN